MEKLITESELFDRVSQIYKEEKIRLAEEKWKKLTTEQKKVVIEMVKQIYPKKAKLISEDSWYNTVGDVLGIIDPFGVVDIINGVSYWYQGDKLFAMLSWISAVPYLGDVLAKPVVAMFKMGKGGAKAFKAAANAGDIVKMAEIAKTSGPLKKLISNVSKWGDKVIEPLKKGVGTVPHLGTGLVKSAEDFVKIFTDANKVMNKGAKETIKLTAKKGVSALTDLESKQLKNALKQATEFRGFRDFGGNKSWLGYMKSDASLLSKLSAGVPRLWGNPATRVLMRKTKWYLSLLDWLGVANTVGPEELENQVENLDQKVQEFSTTPQSQQSFNQDLQSMGITDSSEMTDDQLWAAASQGGSLLPKTTGITTAAETDFLTALFV